MTQPSQNSMECRSSSSLLPLLAGLGIGFTAGLLIAPKSGQRLRADILDSAKQTANDLKSSVVGAVKDNVNGVAEAGAAKAHEAINRTEASLREGAKKSHEAVNETVHAIRTGTEKLA